MPVTCLLCLARHCVRSKRNAHYRDMAAAFRSKPPVSARALSRQSRSEVVDS